MQKILVVGLIIFVLSSCYRPDARQSMQNLHQLEGAWSSSEGVLFNEYWEIKSDTLMIGVGFSLQEYDTAFKEELKIYLGGGDLFYAAKVGESDKFIKFKMKEAKRNRWVFENHEHDYPNIIIYEIDKDRLVAYTTNSNGNKKIEFRMKRP
ncbi:MAG: hypothetical protein KQH67_02730 [Bacteroidetes bacterium]|nr:hypothetical protein [Bacteroidota bacterium]